MPESHFPAAEAMTTGRGGSGKVKATAFLSLLENLKDSHRRSGSTASDTGSVTLGNE